MTPPTKRPRGQAAPGPQGVIVVFARTPERGRVKTRLEPAVGEAGALRLHRAFLADTIEHARETGHEVVLARTPGEAFDHGADGEVAQRGATFGARFDDALAQAARPERPVIVVGVDTPHLPPDAMQLAFEALGEVDAVVGPAPRGGFHLLGFCGPPVAVEAVFAEADEVAALRALLGTAGLTVRELPALDDVDEPEDLRRLGRRLEQDPALAPHSLAALRALQMA